MARTAIIVLTQIHSCSLANLQGQEKEIIILSTTVTRASSAGFASDCQRLNVALTRARRHLIVVGCSSALGNIPAAPAFAHILRVCRRTPGAFWPMGRLQLPVSPSDSAISNDERMAAGEMPTDEGAVGSDR